MATKRKKKVGRPKHRLKSLVVKVSFSLRPGQDDDIIRLVNESPAGELAQRMIAAIRSSTVLVKDDRCKSVVSVSANAWDLDM